MKWTFDITAHGGETTLCVIVVLSVNHFPAALESLITCHLRLRWLAQNNLVAEL